VSHRHRSLELSAQTRELPTVTTSSHISDRQPTELLRLHGNGAVKLDPKPARRDAERMLIVTLAVVGALVAIDVRELLGRRQR
jgi:hypothetical protein